MLSNRFAFGRRGASVLAGLALIVAAPAHAFTYLVGAGGAPCDYSTIQAAINGAASHPGPDAILVSRDQSYTAQALTIGTQDLYLWGGYNNCTEALSEFTQPSGVTVVSGLGGASAPVINITGGGVRDLRNLGVQRGDPGNVNGGGIRFDGHGELFLREVVISNNTAGYGGGVYFFGDGNGAATLTVEFGTLITGNTAQDSGGGVVVAGQARMFMLKDRSSIQGNLALGLLGQGGLGGGVLAIAPARVDIGSPGYNGSAAIDGNEALRGGGLAAVTLSGGDSDVAVRLFSTDPMRPVRVRGNRASLVGGGFYLRPNACGFPSTCRGRAALYMNTFQLDANRAPDGAAIFGIYEDSVGSYILLGKCPFFSSDFSCLDPLQFFPESITALGGLAVCAPGSPGCNSIDHNLNVDTGGTETNGATIAAPNGGVLLTQMTAAGNIGGNLVGGYPALVTVFGSQLILNSLSSDLLRVANNLLIRDSTIASNVLGGATHVIRMANAGYFEMKSSVLWEPGKLTLLYPGSIPGNSNVTIQYNVLSDATTAPGQNNRVADPRFNFPVAGDFRLRISSPALDFAPPVLGTDLDLDGRLYDQQVRPGPRRDLVRDAGAFERQIGDPLLLNGRFDGSITAWPNNAPSFTGYSTQDSGGNTASGSTEINVPAASVPASVTRMTAVSQCFNVPWPGIYRVNGKTLVKVNDLVSFPDAAAIHWKLRSNGTDCSGAITSEGDLFLSNNASGWTTALHPADIVVDEQLYTSLTTIELQLDVLQNLGGPISSGLFARFDDVRIDFADLVLMFSDGFE